MFTKDKGRYKGEIKIEKFGPGVSPETGKPYEIVESENLFLTTGINEIWNLVKGGSVNSFDNANTLMGVGDDSTAPAAGQTDLLAAVNKTYKAMEAGYPDTPSSGAMKFRSIFGTADANFDWNEFVIKQNVSGICINRATSAYWGVKTSGETWTITATLSIS